MRKKLHKILVTGGAGFIGSEFVRQGIKKGYKIVVVDKLTYAGDLARLKEVKGKFRFYRADICNSAKIASIFKKERPKVVVHFAAETHVDRSILGSSSFIQTNVKGTQTLLDLARLFKIYKFIHISTDEVYGEIYRGKFTENSALCPNSPYAASKAAADCLVRSYIRTYNFPAIIIRPCNNYGPWQYPEKFIPVVIYKILNDKEIPIYAKGLNKREWLFVEDCVKSLFSILNKGKIGEIYNIGSSFERKNIEIAKVILRIFGRQNHLIKFVRDRPGHDYRYALNSSKVERIGWRPKNHFKSGIRITVNWYVNNKIWLESKVRYLKHYWKKVYKPK